MSIEHQLELGESRDPVVIVVLTDRGLVVLEVIMCKIFILLSLTRTFLGKMGGDPLIASALPHCTTEDDEYNGYFIPAGTMVLPSVWAMSRDPMIYPDPLSFKPEQWTPGGTSKGVPSLRPQEYAFGFGRRSCPGQNWAECIIHCGFIDYRLLQYRERNQNGWHSDSSK